MEKAETAMDPEFQAMASVFEALKGLEPDSQQRVLEYVSRKLGRGTLGVREVASADAQPVAISAETPQPIAVHAADGVSPIADKWLRRSGLSMPQLEKVFNIGANDEIELVAAGVPGTSKAARVHEVTLLKAIANYLSTGVPKVSHDDLKKTCEHYDAYDGGNHSKYLKAFESEYSGTKASGYTLNGKGLAAAADLIKRMSSNK